MGDNPAISHWWLLNMIQAKAPDGKKFNPCDFRSKILEHAVYQAARGACEIINTDVCMMYSKYDCGNRRVTVPTFSIALEHDSQMDIKGFCHVIHQNMVTNMREYVESDKFSLEFCLEVWKTGQLVETKESYKGCILWCKNTNEYQAMDDAPRPEAANNNKRKRVDEDQSDEESDEDQSDEDQSDEESDEDQCGRTLAIGIRGMLTQSVISSKDAKNIEKYLENHKDMAYAERLELVCLFVRANQNINGNMHVCTMLTQHLTKLPVQDLKKITAGSNLSPGTAEEMLQRACITRDTAL